MNIRQMDSSLIYGMKIRNVVFHCPNSIRCLTTKEGSNLLNCPLKGGREGCEVWRLRSNLESDASIFWDFIQEAFAEITEEDLVCPERIKLELEQKHFLSLSFFGIGKYFAANGFQFPKSWEVIVRILMPQSENPQDFFRIALEELWQDSRYSELLLESLLNDFKNTLLSETSQRGVLLLIYVLKKAIDESSKPIPEEESGKIIDDVVDYLRSH